MSNMVCRLNLISESRKSSSGCSEDVTAAEVEPGEICAKVAGAVAQISASAKITWFLVTAIARTGSVGYNIAENR